MIRGWVAFVLIALGAVVLNHVRQGDPGAVRIAVGTALLRAATRRTR